MSIIDRLRDAFTPIVPDERALTPNQLWATGQDTNWWSTLSSADQPVTANTIMQTAVGAALRLLADDIAALPLDVFDQQGTEPVPVDRPRWLESPSGQLWDTHTDLISDSVMSLHDGNIFYLCQPNVLDIQRIEVLDPTVTTVEQDRNTGQRIYRNHDVAGAALGPDRIVHIPWLRLPGQLRGISPVEALKQSVGSEVAARKWSGAFFANGATLGSIISVPGGPETVDANKLREQFTARHTGEGKWWMPSVITGGATIDKDTITPKDADLGPLYMQAVETAARFFHIPPHLLASQMAGAVSYASVEQRSIEYVQHGIVPITTRIERVLSRLVPGDDTFVKLNVNGLLRGDATSRAEFYRALAELKVMTPKQIAEFEDLPPSQAAAGFFESPNNTLPPEPEPASDDRGLTIDTLTIGDEGAERIADTAAAGAAVAADEVRKVGEASSAELGALRARIDATVAETAQLRDLIRERTEPQAPPVIDIERDARGRPIAVYERRGDSVTKKVITHDADGKIIGVKVA